METILCNRSAQKLNVIRNYIAPREIWQETFSSRKINWAFIRGAREEVLTVTKPFLLQIFSCRGSSFGSQPYVHGSMDLSTGWLGFRVGLALDEHVATPAQPDSLPPHRSFMKDVTGSMDSLLHFSVIFFGTNQLGLAYILFCHMMILSLSSVG